MKLQYPSNILAGLTRLDTHTQGTSATHKMLCDTFLFLFFRNVLHIDTNKPTDKCVTSFTVSNLDAHGDNPVCASQFKPT